MHRVLVIEDNVADAFLFETLWKEATHQLPHNYRIVHALTFCDALRKLKHGRFSTIFLDLKLPDAHEAGMDNIHTLREKYPEIPIVVLTGIDDARTAALAKDYGAAHYLVKGQCTPRMLEEITLSLLRKPVRHRSYTSVISTV